MAFELDDGFDGSGLMAGTGGRMTNTYPDPFFDQATMAMPKTMKALFEFNIWAFYAHELVAPVVRRIAEFPVTDVLVHPGENQDATKQAIDDGVKAWKRMLTVDIDMKTFVVELFYDMFVLGNAFALPIFIANRYLSCSGGCGTTFDEHSEDVKMRPPNAKGQVRFLHNCPKCGNGIPLNIVTPREPRYRVKLLRLSPANIDIEYDEALDSRTYTYTIPPTTVDKIKQGKLKNVLQYSEEFIEAALTGDKLRFVDGRLYHMRAPGLAEQDRGWGRPPLLAAMKPVYQMTILKRSQEALCVSPNTLVETQTGLRPARDIAPGDFLRTHLGRFRPVTTRFERLVKPGEKARRIELATLRHITLLGEYSAEHPMLTLVRKTPAADGSQQLLMDPAAGGECVQAFVRAEEIVPGSYLLYPRYFAEGASLQSRVDFLKGLFSVIGRRQTNGDLTFEFLQGNDAYPTYAHLVSVGCIPVMAPSHALPKLTVSGASAVRLQALFDGASAPEVTDAGPDAFFHADFLAVRVSDVSETTPGLFVNFEVEEDHTYCTAGVATHNCLDHVNPFRVVFPNSTGSTDASMQVGMMRWKQEMRRGLRQQRYDPNYVAFSPIPLGSVSFGGDARGLFITPEMEYIKLVIINCLGIPRELYEGGLTYASSTFSLTVAENRFSGMRTQAEKFMNWFKDQVRDTVKLPDVNLYLKRMKAAADVQKMEQSIRLMQAGYVSSDTVLSDLEFDPIEERRKIELGMERQIAQQHRQTVAAAEANAEAMIVNAKAQVRAQMEQQKLQTALADEMQSEAFEKAQRRRRRFLKAQPPEAIQNYALSGNVAVADITALDNEGRLPPGFATQAITAIKQLEQQAIAAMGIDPMSMSSVPPPIAVKIEAHVLTPSEIYGALMQAFAPPPGEGGEQQGGEQGERQQGGQQQQQGQSPQDRAKGYEKQLASAQSPQDRSLAESRIRSSDPEAAGLIGGGKPADERPMPEHKPPRREGGE